MVDEGTDEERRARLLARAREVAAGKGGPDEAFAMLDQLRDLAPLSDAERRELDAAARPVALPAQLSEGYAQLSQPSPETSDRTHPLGVTAAAIRDALPEFSPWGVEPLEALKRGLQTPMTPRHVIAPGLAEGCEGAFLRATRVPILLDAEGAQADPRTVLTSQTSAAGFATAMAGAKLTDVFELQWLPPEGAVIEAAERRLRALAEAVARHATLDILDHERPDYRNALRALFSGHGRDAAQGGVLREPAIVRLRLYLEPWARAHTGVDVRARDLTEVQGSAADEVPRRPDA